MDSVHPVISTNIAPAFFPAISAPPITREGRPWLLELETDGTIKYSNINPFGINSEKPSVGANFFELTDIGELRSFRKDFNGFIKGDRNRQVFHLRNGTADAGTAIVLTRSFDTTEGGTSRVVILMELKKI